MPALPPKTVERLSAYRRTLLRCLDKGKQYIFSHEIAEMHNITAVQVRRDIMLLGYSSNQKRGYNVKELIDEIGKVLDHKTGVNVAVIGMGNLGHAVTGYFVGKRPKLCIVAAFDVDPAKIGTTSARIMCYPMSELERLVSELNISVALLAVPPEHANEIAQQLTDAGIKGILNFTSVPLNVKQNVYIEEYDMISVLEKVAYFSRK